MKHLLLIGLGGMAGSISRYLMQQAILRHYTTIFPLGTFAVNMFGSLLIGIIFGLAARYDWMNQELRMLLAIGFCGSFTTFSTFAFENLQLIRDANYGQLISYALLSLVAGIFLAWLGFIISRG